MNRGVSDTPGTIELIYDPLMPGAGSGPARPDHEFTLTLERLKNTAPPFPTNIATISGTDGDPSSARVTVNKESDLKQTWTYALVTRPGVMKTTLGKVTVYVPTESKEVVLPFEFKHVKVPQ